MRFQGQPRRLTTLPLAAATFFIVSGGPYGLEEIVAGHGYAATLGLLLATPLAWSLPVALLVGELSSALPRTGGYYVWVRRGLGPFWGLQEAWLSLAVTVVDLAIYPAMLVAYLGQLLPGLARVEVGSPGWAAALAMIALCLLWNLAGIRAVGIGSEWVGALVLLPFAVMVAVAAAALPAGGWERLAASLAAPAPAADGSAWVAGIMVCIWNYMGWDNASTFAGEVEDPGRSYPRAMLLGVLLVAACYLLPVLAAAVVGFPPQGWETGTWVEVARRFGGAPLAGLVVAGGAVTVVGMFNAILLSWSRLPVALAEEGWLPAAFARRSARTGAPVISLATGALLCATCVGMGLRRLIEIDVLIYGASLVLEFAALAALRIREPDLERPFRVPGGLAAACALGVPPTVLFALGAYWVWGEPAALGLTAGEVGLAVAAAGLVWWLGGRGAARPLLAGGPATSPAEPSAGPPPAAGADPPGAGPLPPEA
ncbi:MAG TPA: APC family permease [Anaeromyxobacteraceae bacterium]|nr:APC family permease [Anaeromyxobacteraceae bacterium]